MKMAKAILRGVILFIAIGGILGLVDGINSCLSLLGALQILESIEYYKDKKKIYAILSLAVGICLLVSVISANLH